MSKVGGILISLIFYSLFYSLESRVVDKGALYLRRGLYKKAIKVCKNDFQLGYAYEKLGKFHQAIEYYQKTHPILESYALYRIAHCYKNLEEYEKAINYYEELVEKDSEFVFIDYAMKELGFCYEKLGYYEAALDVWGYEFYPPFSTYRAAKVYEKMDKNSDWLWEKIVYQYPQSPYAKEGIHVLPIDSIHLRGRIYYWAKVYDSAYKYFKMSEIEDKFYVETLYKLGKYKEVIKVGTKIRSYFLVGRSKEKLGDYKGALKAYTKAGGDGFYYKGRLLEKLGKQREALESYIKVPKDSPYFRKSILRVTMLGIELGELDVAYNNLEEGYPPLNYYWKYRISLVRNDSLQANLFKFKLKKDYPLSYYSFLVGGSYGFIPISCFSWIKLNAPTLTYPYENWTSLERGKLLIRLGFIFYGMKELKTLPENFYIVWEIAKFLHTQGLNWLSIPYAKKLKFLGKIPKEVGKVLFPLSYINEIKTYSDTFGIDPYLLLALVREESHFNPNAVSISNAIGLAQIIPPTGREIAKALKVRKYNLFNPRTSLKFGAYYLSQCIKEFGDKYEYALAAYNAGPHRVRKWRTTIDTTEIEKWVENIPFTQTRNYVKKVLRSYYVYQMLYPKKSSHP